MFKNILALCLSCALMVLGSELTLRVIESFQSHPQPSVDIAEFDPIRGWKLNSKITPGTYSRRSEDGRIIDFYVNSDGYRGNEFPPIDPNPAAKRILILGDSFAQADQIRLEERFSEQWETLLNQSGSIRHNVLNLSVSGYSTDQEYLTYLEMGKKLKPQVTVLLFHDNDVWVNNEDIFLTGQKPRVEAQNGTLTVVHYPDKNWAPPPAAEAAAATPKSTLRRFKEYVSERFRLYAWVRKKVRENSRLTSLSARLGLSGVKLADVPDDFRVWSVTPDPEMEAAWAITQNILKDLNQKVREDGGWLIIVYAPPRPALYPEHWLATRIRYGFDEAHWDIRQVPKRLEKICEELNILWIDPSDDLLRRIEETRGKERMYFAVDSHWTREAHSVVARTLLREAAEALDEAS